MIITEGSQVSLDNQPVYPETLNEIAIPETQPVTRPTWERF